MLEMVLSDSSPVEPSSLYLVQSTLQLFPAQRRSLNWMAEGILLSSSTCPRHLAAILSWGVKKAGLN